MSLYTTSEPSPHTNPYFSLAREIFLRSPTPFPVELPEKHNTKSIIDVFGELSKMDEKSQAGFLLQLLSYSTLEPNFAAMADGLEIQQAAAVQRRFKAIVEKNGFVLEDSKRVMPNGPRPKPVVTLPQKRKKTTTRAKTADGQAKKKRKEDKNGSKRVAGGQNDLDKVVDAAIKKSKSKPIKKRVQETTTTTTTLPSDAASAMDIAAQITSSVRTNEHTASHTVDADLAHQNEP